MRSWMEHPGPWTKLFIGQWAIKRGRNYVEHGERLIDEGNRLVGEGQGELKGKGDA